MKDLPDLFMFANADIAAGSDDIELRRDNTRLIHINIPPFSR